MEQKNTTTIPGYRLHRKIGKGGMATVYLATQQSFDRKVALKVISNKAFGNKQLAERFVREAKIVAGLSHPHIVPVYDVGSVANFQYLAMDYLQGGDLSSWIRAGIEPDEAVNIVTGVAQALHYAHSKGYIHRDVKPDNIMFREDNSVVLTDFGIAKPLNANTDMTQLGMVVGTPTYMSPEQSKGEAIDGRADLYSLGVIFYLMLTKQLPYRADEPLALALKHIQEPIPALPETVKKYQPIIDKLMAKTKEDRFDSGLALCKALTGLDKAEIISPQQQSNHANKLAISTEETVNAEKKQHLHIEEKSYRKLGISKRYALHCQLNSTEYNHFSLLFSQLTTRLLEWHNQRGKRCGMLEITLYIEPSIIDRAKHAIDQLYQEGDVYRFLQKMPGSITIFDLNRQRLDALSFGL